MGNSQIRDVTMDPAVMRREIDLSQQLSHHEFIKHLEGECRSQSLSQFPASVVDSVCLCERFTIACNCLTTLPEELPFCMPHLSHLDLGYNHLTQLPESICLLVHLQTLLLKHNRLKSLPNSFVHLSRLERIDLSYNRLEELPEDIGHMQSLKKLNVSHNQLQGLPLSLGESKLMVVILANQNHCTNPPQQICDAGSERLLHYLRKCHRMQKATVREEILNVFMRVRCNEALSSNANPSSPKLTYVKIQTQTSYTTSRIKTPLLPPFGASSLSATQLGDKICGLIYGAVIGDALGVGTEFQTPDECLFNYDPSSMTFMDLVRDEHMARWKKGGWTSNSDQMFLMLDSILHWAGMVDELDFAERLLQWKYQGFPDLEAGEEYVLSETINEVLKYKTYATSPHAVARSLLHNSRDNEAVNSHSDSISYPYCDNGALPRAVILGVPQFHNLKEVGSNSMRICLATHADQRCIASCVAISLLVAQLLQGRDPQDEDQFRQIFHKVRDYTSEYLTDREFIAEFDECLRASSLDSLQLNDKVCVNYTFKPLAAAVFCLQSIQDFRSAVTSVIMQGGHGSMNGCITGALIGCRTGYSKLPSSWISGLNAKQVQWLNSRINSLLDKMGIP